MLISSQPSQGAVSEWNLIVRREADAVGGGEVVRLLAMVRGGRVAAFAVREGTQASNRHTGNGVLPLVPMGETG